jgi:S1-C subfamily serine protease
VDLTLRLLKPVMFLIALASLSLRAEAQSFTEIVPEADRAMGRTVVALGNGASTGSGFVLSRVPGTRDDYYYLTNYHVVEGGKEIIVGFPTDTGIVLYNGAIAQHSTELDLAVLRLRREDSGEHHVPGILAIAVREIRKGETVAALGYPGSADAKTTGLGDPAFFETTLTQGAVSKVSMGSWENNGRQLEIVQHTAAVNTGNSGGPLLDGCGQVVGINTQISLMTLSGVPTNGTFWASSSNAVHHFLADVDVPYATETSACGAVSVPGTTSTNLGGPLPIWVIVAIAVSTVAAVAALTVVLVGRKRSSGSGSPRRHAGNRRHSSKANNAEILHLRIDGGRSIGLTSSQLITGATIGRAASNTIALDDDTLSRTHARVDLSGRTLRITDLGSTNGTCVEGVRLQPNMPMQITTASDVRLGGLRLNLKKPSA